MLLLGDYRGQEEGGFSLGNNEGGSLCLAYILRAAYWIQLILATHHSYITVFKCPRKGWWIFFPSEALHVYSSIPFDASTLSISSAGTCSSSRSLASAFRIGALCTSRAWNGWPTMTKLLLNDSAEMCNWVQFRRICQRTASRCSMRAAFRGIPYPSYRIFAEWGWIIVRWWFFYVCGKSIQYICHAECDFYRRRNWNDWLWNRGQDPSLAHSSISLCWPLRWRVGPMAIGLLWSAYLLFIEEFWRSIYMVWTSWEQWPH